jgi:hypothetical protein
MLLYSLHEFRPAVIRSGPAFVPPIFSASGAMTTERPDERTVTQQEIIMDFGLGILTFGTLGFMVAFGYLSVRAIEKRRREGAPKSTLAADAPNTRSAETA